ncbi:MAG TPA: Hpt domain-containing protein [Novosphingobium sp.]|nr:Hpt domain-containing protein [Novosphingobium sp.]
MVCETGSLDAMIAAAAGDDEALFRELRASFLDSLARQIDLLGRARCDGNWQVAALRLRGLGASFQAWPLIELAEEALGGAPGEPGVLRRLRALHGQLAGTE